MLSSVVERALSSVGVTEERVSRWLGRPCGCDERKQKMDALEAWARRKGSDCLHHLEGILSWPN